MIINTIYFNVYNLSRWQPSLCSIVHVLSFHVFDGLTAMVGLEFQVLSLITSTPRTLLFDKDMEQGGEKPYASVGKLVLMMVRPTVKLASALISAKNELDTLDSNFLIQD